MSTGMEGIIMLPMRNESFELRRGIARAWLLLIPVLISAACGRSDADTAAAVQAQLEKDPVTAPLNLSVTVSDGVASLAGEVRTAEEQHRAIEIARAVVGVSEVVNAMDMDEDLGLAAAVRSALAEDPALASVPIDVDAQDGFVRLISDATTSEQRELAVAVASAVDGVREVEDRMK